MMTDGSSRLDQRDLLHESGAEVPAPEVPHGLGVVVHEVGDTGGGVREG